MAMKIEYVCRGRCASAALVSGLIVSGLIVSGLMALSTPARRPVTRTGVGAGRAGYLKAVTDFLAIYLRDHHAAAQAGVSLAARAAGNVELPASLAGELATVAAEIEEDLRALEAVMEGLEIDTSRTKDALASVGERLARLKANGRVIDRSPLSDVLELEALRSGIVAKESLWRSLALADRKLPARIDLERLIERAQHQRDIVERCRVEAAQVAFGSPVDAPA
jgi:hypothetical protein